MTAFLRRNFRFCINLRQYTTASNYSYIRALQEWVKDHEPVTFKPLSVNLNCGSSGPPFSKAPIDVYQYATDSKGNVVSQDILTDENVKDIQTYSIQLDQLYPVAFEALRHVSQSGVITLPAPAGAVYPIAALLMFLSHKDIHKHKDSILRLNREYTPQAKMMSEGEISAILGVHLVSQLVGQSPSAYMVSNDTYGRTRLCPCGCFTEVTYGNTNFGSKELWYARPDMMAFPDSGGSINVVLQKGSTGGFYEDSDTVSVDDEKESVIKAKSWLDDIENIGQIMLQTITFAFYQKVFQKKQKIPDSDLVSLIPTVALCNEEAHIYMYDTKYDICLKNSSPLPFWNENSDALNLNTLITLWMAFYHLSFRPCFPESAINILQRSSGFQERVGIDKLEEIVKSMKMEEKISRENDHTLPIVKKVIPI